MTPDYVFVVVSWLGKAKSDLASARILIEGAEPHLDTGCYHCQQAAAKALKRWLTSCQIEFRKTHDLGELLAQCSASESQFDTFKKSISFLQPFATQFRYPGDLFEPPIEEAREALLHAAIVLDFVVSNLKARHPDPLADL